MVITKYTLSKFLTFEFVVLKIQFRPLADSSLLVIALYIQHLFVITQLCSTKKRKIRLDSDVQKIVITM